MSIATEIDSIKTNLTNAYAKCQAKSATIPTNKNMANLAGCIESIKQSPVAFNGTDTIFGCGTVDSTGTLTSFDATQLDMTKNIVLGGFNTVGASVLYQKFLSFTGEKVEFPTVKEIKNSGMFGCFSCYRGAQGVTGEVTFPALETIGNSGMSACFDGNNITKINFPVLKTVNSNGFQDAFAGTHAIEANFPVLEEAYVSAFQNAFEHSLLTTISFPALTTMSGNVFTGDSFANSPTLTEYTLGQTYKAQ